MQIVYDEWRGNDNNTPVFFSKTLFRFKGWKICLHKFVESDREGCFHTHPAKAWRVVLRGGYKEKLPDGTQHTLRPGYIGKVMPDYAHRISELLNGEFSYSLWIRGPITHKIKLIGDGWDVGNW